MKRAISGLAMKCHNHVTVGSGACQMFAYSCRDGVSGACKV